MFMGKGSVEDVTNIRHRVHADGRALENGALGKRTTRGKQPDFKSTWHQWRGGKSKNMLRLKAKTSRSDAIKRFKMKLLPCRGEDGVHQRVSLVLRGLNKDVS